MAGGRGRGVGAEPSVFRDMSPGPRSSAFLGGGGQAGLGPVGQVLFSPALAVLALWAQHPHTSVLTDTQARRILSSGVVPGLPAPHLHGLLAPSSHFRQPRGCLPLPGQGAEAVRGLTIYLRLSGTVLHRW